MESIRGILSVLRAEGLSVGSMRRTLYGEADMK